MSAADLKYHESTGATQPVTVQSFRPPQAASTEVANEHATVNYLVSDNTSKSMGIWQFSRDIKSSLPLIAGDFTAVLLSFALLTVFTQYFATSASLTSLPLVLGFCCFVLGIHHIHGLYPACGLPYSIEFRRVLRTALIASGGFLLACFAASEPLARVLGTCLFFVPVLTFSLVAVRIVVRSLLANCDWWAQPVLVIANGADGHREFESLSKNRSEGLRPMGVALVSNVPSDEDSEFAPSPNADVNYVGPVDQLEQILRQSKACRVVVTASCLESSLNLSALAGIPHVTIPTRIGTHPTERTRLQERNGVVEAVCYNAVSCPTARSAKRMLDIGLILLSLPVLLPLGALLIALVKLNSPGPVFYASRRIGFGGRIFRAWKFRSMVTNGNEVLEEHFAEHPEDREIYRRERKLVNDPRITTIGSLLRKTSLDELPQLWNVLVGDMSLVGPRPMLEDELEQYGDVYALYISMRPGLTGLWQISGRNKLAYEARLNYARFYVQNWSCTLDLYILWKTIRTIISQEGAY